MVTESKVKDERVMEIMETVIMAIINWSDSGTGAITSMSSFDQYSAQSLFLKPPSRCIFLKQYQPLFYHPYSTSGNSCSPNASARTANWLKPALILQDGRTAEVRFAAMREILI